MIYSFINMDLASYLRTKQYDVMVTALLMNGI